MNLAQHLSRFYKDMGEANTNRFTVDEVIDWLDEAEARINMELHGCIPGSVELDSVANQREYSFPADLLDYFINKIYYSTSDSNQRREIDPIEECEMDSFSPSWRETTGSPKKWYLSRERLKYGFYPYEKSVRVGTNCILMYYRKRHTKMTRFYTTGTITVTNNSPTVTGSGTAFIGNVQPGDQIGIGKFLNRQTAFPVKWYTVLTVDSNTQITLTANYAEANGSGSSFIACANSSIPFSELNLCSVLYAQGKAKFKDSDYNGWTTLEDMALSRAKRQSDNVERTAASMMPMMPAGEISIPRGGRFLNDYQ